MTKVTDTQELMPKVNSKTDAELFSDLDATVGWAKSQGGDGNRLGIMGFCRGAALYLTCPNGERRHGSHRTN